MSFTLKYFDIELEHYSQTVKIMLGVLYMITKLYFTK